MKKSLLLFLSALLMTASLAGCGIDKEPEKKNNNSSVEEKERMVPDELVNEDGIEFTPDLTTEGEIEKDAEHVSSDKVVINGKSYKLPVRMSDLYKDGWKLSVGTFKDEFKPKTKTNLVSFGLKDKDGKIITLTQIYNDKDKVAKLEDCLLIGFSVDTSYQNPAEFILPGGITGKSTVGDVIYILGEPNDNNADFESCYILEKQITYEKHKKSGFRYSFTFNEDGSIDFMKVEADK